MRYLWLTLCLLFVAPSATADTFEINEADNDCAHIYSFGSGAQNNYGAMIQFEVGTPFSPRRFQAAINFPGLRAEMVTVGAATWDSAYLKIVVKTISNLGVGTSIPDTLAISVNKITTIWDEGTHASGGATGGITWDSASATGTGGAEPNSPLDWSTDGGDFNATAESDSVISVGGEVSIGDTLTFKIKGTSIADTTTDYGYMIHYAHIADGDDASSTCGLSFYSDDEATAARRPRIIVWYTTGAPAAVGQFIMINTGN